MPRRAIPKATLKYNVAALANIFRSSLFVSSDIYITRNMAVDVGVGWFFGSVLRQFQEESFNGYRQRIGFKYLFFSDRKVSPYIGAETKFNYIQETRIETLSMSGGQYTELTPLKRNTQTYGIAFRGGAHFIPGKNRRFILDIYTGIGYKYTAVKMPIPANAELLTFENMVQLEKNPGNYHLPDFLFGINVGYCFH